MKFSSPKTTLLACLVIAAAVTTSGCGVVNGIRAKSELNEGARLYRSGDFDEALFIKAPRTMRYEEVVKVIDALKGAGARPIGLQLVDLE